jgi:hypothetical protein
MANDDDTERVAEEIRQRGFIRWHERTLMRAHLHLVTCLLGAVLIGVGFEAFSNPEGLWQWLRRYGTMFGGAMLVMFGWVHYRMGMQRAQRRADRANCPRCGAYGAFDVKTHGLTPADDKDPADDLAGGWIRVACRRCGEQWNI